MTWENLSEDVADEFTARDGCLDWEAKEWLSFGVPRSLNAIENYATVSRLRNERLRLDDLVGDCEQCGKKFGKNHHSQKYCSRQCRNVVRRHGKPVAGVCEWCGEYFCRKAAGRSVRFCSKLCKVRHWNHHNPRPWQNSWHLLNRRVSEQRRLAREARRATCEVCGVEYKPQRKSRFCSQKCNVVHFNRKQVAETIRRKLETPRQCEVCSKDISLKNIRAKLCGSEKCAYRSKLRRQNALAISADQNRYSSSTTQTAPHEFDRA